MLAYLYLVLAWINVHPYLATALIWPLVTGVVTLIFHSRSPEEYAARSPRVAAFFKLLAAVGVDVPKMVDGLKLAAGGETPAERAAGLVSSLAAVTLDVPKAIEALRQLVTGTSLPVSSVVPIFAVLVMACGLSACSSWQQGAKTTIGVIEAACVVANQDLPNADIAKACGIADALSPSLLQLLSSARQTTAAKVQKVSADHCSGAAQ